MTVSPDRLLAAIGVGAPSSPFLGFTIGCPHQDADDLEPGPDGDPACGECRSNWADLDDAAEYRHYAYH